MSNVANLGKFYPRRVSEYVPAMSYSSDVQFSGGTRVDFGTPATASATAILSAQSINSAGTVDLSAVTAFDAPYGRTVAVVASGAATSLVTLTGRDYLGQIVVEQFTLNGTTAVQGVKAFKDFIQEVHGATSSTTINMGHGNKLGLPYKAIKVNWETTNQTLAAAGTLTAPSLTDPQTATTSDPRGLYTPTTSPDGTKALTAEFEFLNDVNTNNRGGLMGLPHYGG